MTAGFPGVCGYVGLCTLPVSSQTITSNITFDLTVFLSLIWFLYCVSLYIYTTFLMCPFVDLYLSYIALSWYLLCGQWSVCSLTNAGRILIYCYRIYSSGSVLGNAPGMARPVCPIYLMLQSGLVSWYTPLFWNRFRFWAKFRFGAKALLIVLFVV